MNNTNRKSTLLHMLIFAFTVLACTNMMAEGTREVAPNGSIMIDGNNTTDIAALHLDHPSYNRFGSYTNPDENNRLRIRIVNPGEECIYLGFSVGHLNQTTPTPPQVSFEFRIKDPAGNIVYGPITIDPSDANINSWSEAFSGPIQINGVSGYNAMLVSSADLMSQGWSGEGDYYIEFQEASGQPLLIDFWDITVVNCATTFPEERKGRVWSYNWAIFAINDFGFPVRPFNGAFYVCAPDPDNANAAFVTQIDFNGAGFRPAAFNVAFNSFGSMNTGNIVMDRRSVENNNATQPEYAIFLNDPIEFCETAIIGDVLLLGITRCSQDDYCVKFISSKEGLVNLLFDFDGPDDIYTPGTADLLISTYVSAEQVGEPTCIDWDGLDGLGIPISEDAGTQIPVVISYAQGIYHFPIYDAEFMDNGFTINAIRPTGSTPLLFYDDSDISVASGSGEPAVQLQGCTVPCHRWSIFNDPNVPGFGNLNTINSWWFSQLIVKKDVFLMPSYFACGIEGPDSTCEGDTAVLSWMGSVIPDGADAPTLISTLWSGPDIIGGNTGITVQAGSAGLYTVDAMWETALGDTCGTSCNFDLLYRPASTGVIDTLIGFGDTLYVNGEEYTDSGEYEQVLIAANGCDSTLIIILSVPQTVIHYDLDACASIPSQGTNIDYSEFTPEHPDTLDCALISAGIIHRVDPAANPHSCTPGVSESIAMCVSSHNACGYDPGNDKSVIFEVTLSPEFGEAVSITSMVFFEKAPETFDWIDGASGPNNYPTLYGIRILKNGTEIFREEDIPTSGTWSEQRFDFLDNEAFTALSESTFKFELLGYCLIGNGAPVAAWDLDEVNVHAACAAIPPSSGLVKGTILSASGRKMEGVSVFLAQDPSFTKVDNTNTDVNGVFTFENAVFDTDHFIRGYKNDDCRDGLSTLDILLMQKHILGLQPFESAYQFVAGDVNNDQRISATDLLDIRKLLLGQLEEFPLNNSWRFGDVRAKFDLNNPWRFNDIVELKNLNEDYRDADFVGIKIGDVSGNVNAAFANEYVQTRSGDDIILEIRDVYLEAGETIKFAVSGYNLAEVKGLQFALKVNGLLIERLDGTNVDLDHGNYSISKEGLIFSWDGTIDTNLEPDRSLFTISVTALRNGNISDFLNIDKKAMHAEAYLGEDLSINNVAILFAPEESAPVVINTMKVAPNPFSTSTHIKLTVAQEGDVSMSFCDISGRVLYAQKLTMAAGSHEFEVTKDQLKMHSGVVICRVVCDGVSMVKRLLVVE